MQATAHNYNKLNAIPITEFRSDLSFIKSLGLDFVGKIYTHLQGYTVYYANWRCS